MLEVTTTTYLTLNGSAVLWDRLVDGVTQSDLIESLVERYGITVEKAEGDVGAFLDVLQERSLLDPAV